MKNISTAEAYAIQLQGEAEANAMTAKAEAYNKYGMYVCVCLYVCVCIMYVCRYGPPTIIINKQMQQ